MKLLTNEEIAMLRVDYTLKKFDETDVLPDPLEQFKVWFNEAVTAQVNEPNAMTLASVKPDGSPSARIVLLKGFDKEGFTFFTNYKSHKGEQLIHNPRVALVFCWLELQRQVRIEGTVYKLSDSENDAYFYSRPVGSQIGAVVSPQSQVISGRDVLERDYEIVEQGVGTAPIKRPEHWGGYIVKPAMVEFWQGRSSRLHDRFEFIRNEQAWIRNRLAP